MLFKPGKWAQFHVCRTLYVYRKFTGRRVVDDQSLSISHLLNILLLISKIKKKLINNNLKHLCLNNWNHRDSFLWFWLSGKVSRWRNKSAVIYLSGHSRLEKISTFFCLLKPTLIGCPKWPENQTLICLKTTLLPATLFFVAKRYEKLVQH